MLTYTFSDRFRIIFEIGHENYELVRPDFHNQQPDLPWEKFQNFFGFCEKQIEWE